MSSARSSSGAAPPPRSSPRSRPTRDCSSSVGADAVASAALHVGVPGKRRLVVLVAAGGAEDSSALGAAGVRAYLDELHVPLAVWRMQSAARPEWLESRTIVSVDDFRAAILDAKERLDCQAVVWTEP